MFSTEQDSTSKPYDQLPGEPGRWYEHFRQFCDLGPSRSLDHCYRQFLQDHGDPALTASHAPGSWKRKAVEFDWTERAAARDADRRHRNLP